jgi:DNA-directed RNA polymerase subunit beta
VNLKGKVSFLSAEEEDTVKIAQSNIEMDEKGNFKSDKIKSRYQGDFPILAPGEVQYMDVAPNQIVGVSASLIPFLEHDDANRALMGSNMQRQAVPLLKPQAPIVGTGLEKKVAQDSRNLINAEREGVVEYVDANEIIIKYERTEEEKLVSFKDDKVTYKLQKFLKTNQSTCINLKPLVRKGQRVSKGQVFAKVLLQKAVNWRWALT